MSDPQSPNTPAPPAQPLFDLSGMSTEDARSYIFSLATHLKKTEADLKSCEVDLLLWTGRLELATSKGTPELQVQASSRVEELKGKKLSLEMEVWEFREGISKLKKDLMVLPSTQRTVNPQALQEQLEQIIGGHDAVTPAVKKWEADEALEQLKKKLESR